MPPGALLHDLVISWQITERALAGRTTFVHQEIYLDNRGKYRMYLNSPTDIRKMARKNGCTPSLPLTVNEVPVKALLDTGSAVSTISVDTLKQLGVDEDVDPTGGILLRTAIEHTYKAISSINICIGASEQQLTVAARVFLRNTSDYDVILGWPEFQTLMKTAS